MNERIKQLRKEIGLSQQAFADKVKITQNYVWMIEKGDRDPGERLIDDICKEFGVSETWLRTGAGEMFPKQTRKDVLSAYFGQIIGGTRTELEEMLLELMAETSVEEWEALAEKFKRIAEKKPGD